MDRRKFLGAVGCMPLLKFFTSQPEPTLVTKEEVEKVFNLPIDHPIYQTINCSGVLSYTFAQGSGSYYDVV